MQILKFASRITMRNNVLRLTVTRKIAIKHSENIFTFGSLEVQGYPFPTLQCPLHVDSRQLGKILSKWMVFYKILKEFYNLRISLQEPKNNFHSLTNSIEKVFVMGFNKCVQNQLYTKAVRKYAVFLSEGVQHYVSLCQGFYSHIINDLILVRNVSRVSTILF